jgi:hypothetical protein
MKLLRAQSHARPMRSFVRKQPKSVAFSSPCVFLATFSGRSANSNRRIHLPPANYSYKAVSRVFPDSHSVPVKLKICFQSEQLVHTLENRRCVPAGTFLYVHNVPARSPRSHS